ncbi:hypothetical protein KOR42_24870 [Thalassoglobus neptunius]|uniref:Uncharacterized protein n=1 Tax=Thalassoglobus neptunius TaxID=1938619 RepID=A0A5C5X8D2_9PLAN|nr:hypothetical protein [Thalassoglobus neptunius]TWT59098.1 hypothetical protein KOR42_24870 [Thalassoglobus neptunius]
MNRNRQAILFVSLILAWSQTSNQQALGQVQIGPKGPVATEPEKAKSDIKLHQLTVTATAEPVPVLKWRLYPTVDQRTPGNSVPLWYRSLLQLNTNSETGAWFNRINELSPSEKEAIDWEEVAKAVEEQSLSLDSARRAAFRSDCNWELQIGELRGPETVWLRLGEFQELRELGRILCMKAAVEVQGGEFDRAIETMQTAMRLGTDVAKPETFINDLIGIALQRMTLTQVERWIAHPDSPNLYWALAQLPRPMIEIRSALEMEMTLPQRFFPWLADPLAEERTPEQWNELMMTTIEDGVGIGIQFPGLGNQPTREEVELAYQQFAVRNYAKAKGELTEFGWTEDDVEQMPVGQVLALREFTVYQNYTQTLAANAFLPFPESQSRADDLYQALSGVGRESVVGMLLPAVQQVYIAQQRLETYRNLYMVVEAIRMHLSLNDGQLPSSLDEITVVPAPNDPFTEEPFQYTLKEGVAVIDVRFPGWHNRYEIRVNDGAETR